MTAEHDREDAPHDHGQPFAWDPEAARARRGKRLIAIGALLVVLGAILWWLGERYDLADL